MRTKGTYFHKLKSEYFVLKIEDAAFINLVKGARDVQ